jgi:DNA-binding NarL/FixJ family response regulator
MHWVRKINVENELIENMSVERKLKVFLIEDASRIRSILIDVLQRTGRIEVIGFAEGECDALNQLRTIEWDVAIVDIRLNEGSGLGVLAGLKDDLKSYGKRLVFTNSPSPDLRVRSMALGADDFFDKSKDLDMLVCCLQAMLD